MAPRDTFDRDARGRVRQQPSEALRRARPDPRAAAVLHADGQTLQHAFLALLHDMLRAESPLDRRTEEP